MRVGLRVFRPDTIAWLRKALRRGQLSRAALGRGICELEDWRNPKGAYCSASARKVLPELAAQLELPLPPAQPGSPACHPRAGPDTPAPSTCFAGSLAELGPVRLRLAASEAQRRLCAALLDQHHPLGPGRAPGCRLSDLLEAACGPLGVLSFVAAPFRLGPRDDFLGWDARTRGAHLQRVVSNDRFLLVAGVQVPNLASHVLGQAVERQARGGWGGLFRPLGRLLGVRSRQLHQACEQDPIPIRRGKPWSRRTKNVPSEQRPTIASKLPASTISGR